MLGRRFPPFCPKQSTEVLLKRVRNPKNKIEIEIDGTLVVSSHAMNQLAHSAQRDVSRRLNAYSVSQTARAKKRVFSFVAILDAVER